MANTSNFPGGATPNYEYYSWSGNSPIRTNSFTLPAANLCDNGKRPMTITNVRSYISGKGATRSVAIGFDTTYTSNFNVSAASKANLTSWQSISKFYSDQQSAVIRISFNGDIYFGRADSAGTTYDAFNYSWPGAICGQFQWIEAPTKPPNPDLVPVTEGTPGFEVNINPSSSNGGSAITGYDIRYWPTSDPGDVTVVSTTSTYKLVNGLGSGVEYSVRVAAKNAVTTSAGTRSVYSNVVTVTTPGTSGGSTGTVTIEVWDGTTWSTM